MWFYTNLWTANRTIFVFFSKMWVIPNSVVVCYFLRWVDVFSKWLVVALLWFHIFSRNWWVTNITWVLLLLWWYATYNVLLHIKLQTIYLGQSQFQEGCDTNCKCDTKMHLFCWPPAQTADEGFLLSWNLILKGSAVPIVYCDLCVLFYITCVLDYFRTEPFPQTCQLVECLDQFQFCHETDCNLKCWVSPVQVSTSPQPVHLRAASCGQQSRDSWPLSVTSLWSRCKQQCFCSSASSPFLSSALRQWMCKTPLPVMVLSTTSRFLHQRSSLR